MVVIVIVEEEEAATAGGNKKVRRSSGGDGVGIFADPDSEPIGEAYLVSDCDYSYTYEIIDEYLSNIHFILASYCLWHFINGLWINPSAASGSTFFFGSTFSSNSPSQPMFGNSAFAASPGNNDNMKYNIIEDLVQFGGQQSQAAPQNSPSFAALPALAVSSGQPSVFPSRGGFAFGSAVSAFQFGGQQSQATPQNSPPFAASPAPAISFGQYYVSPSRGGFAFGSVVSAFQFGGQQSQAAPQNFHPFAASPAPAISFGQP
ncbi:hypothetical protein CQW23_28013 [Capsicum baccatum]|uniref:Uncharacterized protein n=1 Tax=Capsicum baccatum TaxID=33114 RepID=A0A2G2VFC8_CAPBA|nr:hypothetical protein CQW23_28013 [Capsicum baccatum]